MPRSFDMAADYEGSVEQVYRALSDEQYWLARLAGSGADEATLDALAVSADGIEVKTTQVLRADRLPAVATQFHRGDLAVERAEVWSPVHAGQAAATVNAAILGAPASMTGSATLAPAAAGAGCRLAVKASVEVRIPLVGGKIETIIGSQLVNLIIAEQRFTTEWIAENA
jgi:hypothetical protein